MAEEGNPVGVEFWNISSSLTRTAVDRIQRMKTQARELVLNHPFNWHHISELSHRFAFIRQHNCHKHTDFLTSKLDS